MKLSTPTSASAGPEMPIPLPGTAVGPDPPGFGSWGGRGVPGADVEAEGGRFPKNAFEMPRRGNAADSYSDRPETSNGAEARRASSSAIVDAIAGATACVVAGARAAVGIADPLTERSPEDIGPVGSPRKGSKRESTRLPTHAEWSSSASRTPLLPPTRSSAEPLDRRHRRRSTRRTSPDQPI